MCTYGNCHAVLRTCHGGDDADCSTDVSTVQWTCLGRLLLAVRRTPLFYVNLSWSVWCLLFNERLATVPWMCLVAMLLAVRWTLDQDSGRSSAALLDLLGRGSSLVLLVVVGD